MRSVMKHSFSEVPKVAIPRSSFDRSHGLKTAFDANYIYPIYVDEALPGDTASVRLFSMLRMSTPVFPVMDNLYADVHFFSCPLRLLQDNFKKLMGEQDNPGDSIDYQAPVIDVAEATYAASGHAVESLFDYLGIPTEIPGLEHNTYHSRMYNKVYNEWYRPEDLVDSAVVDTDDGPDDPTDYVLRKRAKRHDYFTSCLPWPVKNDAEVNLPLGTTAPVTGIGKFNQIYNLVDYDLYETGATGTRRYDDLVQIGSSTNTYFYVEEDPNNAGFPNIRADLTNATASTINDLRQAFQIQRLLERDARGGTRFNEMILSHFGVTVPDFRIQRTEYLGGGTMKININPVVQTANSTDNAGDLAAFATAHANGNIGFTKSFVEHSVILGLISVRADLTYQQGLQRMFSRSTRYDWYFPSLAHLGEQAVLNKEIYAQNDANDDLVFGYNERWSEYRYRPSQITGKFRSTYATSLDAWHLSQEFTSLPTLSQTFIEENVPMDRILQVTTEPEFIMDAYFKQRWARPIPLFSVPGLIDHF